MADWDAPPPLSLAASDESTRISPVWLMRLDMPMMDPEVDEGVSQK